MTASISFRNLAIACGALLSLSACGGSSDEGAVTSTTDFYERIYGGESGYTDQQKQIEDKTAECMKRLGWEYTPVDYAAASAGSSPVSVDQVKFRKDWGYGISTLIGHEDENPYGVPTDGGFKDPNQDYVAALSQSDQTAYYADLYGPPTEPPSDGSDPVYDPATAKGCNPEASYAVMGNSPAFDQKLGEELSKMEEAVANDERVAKANEKWVACMNDGGIKDFTKPDDIFQFLNDKLSMIMGYDNNPAAQEGGSTATVVASASAVGVGSVSADDTSPAPGDPKIAPGGNGDYDKVKLAALQAEEMKISALDDSCQTKFVTKVVAKVRQEYQDQFVSDHPQLASSSK
jgi:hypothetical protein